MFKALRNFKCNGIKKVAGEKIDKKDVESFGDFRDQLINSGLMISLEDQKKVEAQIEAKENKGAKKFEEEREKKKASRAAAKKRVAKEK